MTPKFHFSLHLADALRRHTLLISCFTHERRHKIVKKFANTVTNTTSYEKSLCEHLVLQHLHDLKGANFTDAVYLVDPKAHKESPGLSSASAVIFGHPCKKGDVVRLEGTPKRFGQLLDFREDVPGTVYAFMNLLQPLDPSKGRWRITSQAHVVVPATEVMHTCTYHKFEDIITVLDS
jgi:hypothetical protein